MSQDSNSGGWGHSHTPEDQEAKVITIDGPAGSGKSTVSRLLALQLGWQYITTGALYRTLALMLHEAGASVHDKGTVERFVAFLAERYRQDSRSGRVYLGERELTSEIRSAFVSEQASLVAQEELVRRKLLPVQRRVVLETNGAVVDGRDMGTVVFPDARLKVYLTASPEIRALRRIDEMSKLGLTLQYQDLVKEIEERDERDSTRKLAPMRAAQDAHYLDSSNLSPPEIVNKILEMCLERGLLPSVKAT